jgi:hypothetical protein
MHCKAKQYKAKQSNPKHNKATQSNAKQSNAKQSLFPFSHPSLLSAARVCQFPRQTLVKQSIK